MFSSSIQPPTVSLFSSTSSAPLSLFSSHSDPQLPSDSFIHLLNDSTSTPAPPPPATLITPSSASESTESADGDEARPGATGYSLCQTVLHIQSPTLRTTYVRCPPVGYQEHRGHLGLKHPWMHIQVRDLGREWSFEVGVVDRGRREGVIRCSTFQKNPRLSLTSPPLLHLPLSFPAPSAHKLTTWSTIALHLPSLLPHFTSAALVDAAHEKLEAGGRHAGESELPSGAYAHVSYVKVYASCRLRRVWFSESGPGGRVPWEFELYAAE